MDHTPAPASPSKPSLSFLHRHQFLILRLHSLTGIVPVGAYMCVHLLTNASVLAGTRMFQENVDKIHSLGPALPFVEWGFIFLPLIFHAVVGVIIIRTGLSNSAQYPHRRNIRYTLQRATAWIALFFIMWHVFQMHGWVPSTTIRAKIAATGYGAQFQPHNATSSVALALQPIYVKLLYTFGILATVYHLANGIWTSGITWGVWTSPAAQSRATWACLAFGLLIAFLGMGALFGFGKVDVKQAQAVEDVLNADKHEIDEQIQEKLEQLKKSPAKTAQLPSAE